MLSNLILQILTFGASVLLHTGTNLPCSRGWGKAVFILDSGKTLNRSRTPTTVKIETVKATMIPFSAALKSHRLELYHKVMTTFSK